MQPLFVVVDGSDLEILNNKNKRAAVFCDRSVGFIDKCFDVKHSHCNIFSEWNTLFFYYPNCFKNISLFPFFAVYVV